MTPEITLVVAILAAAMILLVTQWIPMEATALLVLASVAITGLLPPAETLAGFSSPAVVTVWAVFILSGGLTHTGVANVIGHVVLKIAGAGETAMIVVIMATAGLLSAIMNNVAVAALMLPVVTDIAGQTKIPSSRLLMPLAFGALMGGMATQIGTPPNILVSEALRDHGLEPFSFFDFTPAGLAVTVSGILFMAVAGRHLLSGRRFSPDPEKGANLEDNWQTRYHIEERLFHATAPNGSPLAGKSLSASGLGAILGWNVISITRNGRSIMTPGPGETIHPGDLLTVEGQLESMGPIRELARMKIARSTWKPEDFREKGLFFCETAIPDNSPLTGQPARKVLPGIQDAAIVAVRKKGKVVKRFAGDVLLEGNERILTAAGKKCLGERQTADLPAGFRKVDEQILISHFSMGEEPFELTITPGMFPSGSPLGESRVPELTGVPVLAIIRGNETIILPSDDEIVRDNDRLIVPAEPDFLIAAIALSTLEVHENMPPMDIRSFLTGDTGLVEAILSPGSSIEKMTLRDLNFREKYGLNVLAIRRRGKTFRSRLQDMKVFFGDALLLFGPTQNLRMLNREPDFVVLARTAQERYRTEKMKISLLILAAFVFTAVMGWVPIYIAAVTGAAFMVLGGCLTMEEAYRQIEWKAVFLIAGMMPLGAAMEQSGAAMLAAGWVVEQAGRFGPEGILAGLITLTMLATCVIPIPAVVVLMIPVVLGAAESMVISPHSLLMGVSLAASASFITPLSHPAKLMVMGPGGYSFADYLKTGIPLTLVVWIVLVAVVPLLWPLTP